MAIEFKDKGLPPGDRLSYLISRLSSSESSINYTKIHQWVVTGVSLGILKILIEFSETQKNDWGELVLIDGLVLAGVATFVLGFSILILVIFKKTITTQRAKVKNIRGQIEEKLKNRDNSDNKIIPQILMGLIIIAYLITISLFYLNLFVGG